MKSLVGHPSLTAASFFLSFFFGQMLGWKRKKRSKSLFSAELNYFQLLTAITQWPPNPTEPFHDFRAFIDDSELRDIRF